MEKIHLRTIKETLICGSFDIFSLQTLESAPSDDHMGHEGVQLLGRILILVTKAGKAHSHPERYSADSLGPDGFVETSVDPHVGGSHLLLSELLDLLYSARGPVLEANAMKTLVEVDGVFTGHNLAHSGGLVTLAGRHDLEFRVF